MSSGGRQKDVFSKCFIEAPEELAATIFKDMIQRNPDHVTCNCCGEDYSYWEYGEEGFDEDDFEYYTSEKDSDGYFHGWDHLSVIFIPKEAWESFYTIQDQYTDL